MSQLGRFDVLRVFGRSLFLQAGFNPEGLQTLGLLYALAPALRKLYPDPVQYQAAVQRHLSPFNTHPYVAAAIVGGILYYEERVARGEVPPERVAKFKAALMGPLAALGDGFFWLSLRPAASAVAAVLAPWLGAWAAVGFFVFYNLVHVWTRALSFRHGYLEGEQMLGWISTVRLPERGQVLRVLAAVASGGVGALLATQLAAGASGAAVSWWAPACLGVGAAVAWLSARGVSAYLLLYGVGALALVVGALH